MWAAAIALAAVVCVQAQSRAHSDPFGSGRPEYGGELPLTSRAELKPLLQRYCFACHSQQTKAADLTLDTVDPATPTGDAQVWEKVIRRLRARTMPPLGSPRPDAGTYDKLAEWLEQSLDAQAASHPNPGHAPVIHRLNRAEYVNAIRDLLTIDIDEGLLPADDSGYGFDNIADVLSVSPMLMERYLSIASTVSRIAIGDPSIKPATETFAVGKYVRQSERLSESQPFASRGGLVIHHYFPVDGEYIVKIFFDRIYDDSRLRGFAEPNQLEVRLNGVKIKGLTVGGPPSTADAGSEAVASDNVLRGVDTDGLEVRFPVKAGSTDVAVTFVKRATAPEGMLRPQYPITSYEYAADIAGPAGIRKVELRGPYNVTGPGNSPSRQRLFVCQPSASESEAACARQILGSLARRAYRRPVFDADLRPPLDLFKQTRVRDTFDVSIAAAVRLILASPHFLFRIEPDHARTNPDEPYRISDVELASRLSFFLWSSIPDDLLLDVAVKGQLSKPEVLARQVTRMLSDRRASALVKNFAGQWLYLRNIALLPVDPSAFPDFDDNVRAGFTRELELFLDSQIREDHGIPELLTADYTYLNERLARHYGIAGVYGDHYRRVTLTDDYRKGLLGKGGLLMVTSYSNRTSPVKRGRFLLDNFLGAPPPPAPPNVPALQSVAASNTPLTMRERMEAHRSNPRCASCHLVMDPLGFALENFDAVGRWRTSEGNALIDASGILADGTAVDGLAGLRAAVLSRRDQFAQTVIEKLLTYALGRGAEFYDGPAVRQILRNAAPADYRWSAVILGIVRSAPFQLRMPRDSNLPALTASSR